jgi:transcriptional regulator with XRE-family HTH domain
MDMQSFGQRVRTRRLNEDWSQEELAEKIGISRNYLSQIERGVAKNLSWRLVEQLTTVLGLSPSEIFGLRQEWEGLPPGLSEFASKANLPPQDVEMLSQIRYRGDQPTTPQEWKLLYNAIKVATGRP